MLVRPPKPHEHSARHQWLASVLNAQNFSVTPVSSDASFRSYHRVHHNSNSWIVMDAPPDKEPLDAFLHVANLLTQAGLHVPHVYAQNRAQGFLLLSDLGDQTYLQALTSASQTSDSLYHYALRALVQLQRNVPAQELPEYSELMLGREMDLFPQWYLAIHRQYTLGAPQLALWLQVRNHILARIRPWPHPGMPHVAARVAVHRDYHSRNLMACEPMPGILDFQDAVSGVATYDLVSLLKDAYVRLPASQQLSWLSWYWQIARKAGIVLPATFAELVNHFHWIGLQRHLKILGIFARLHHRDGKSDYLADIPRVEDYVREFCAAHDFTLLATLLDQVQQ